MIIQFIQNVIKFIQSYMNTQVHLSNPSYSLRQSNLSMGKLADQPLIYAGSQVNALPNNLQKQYFVTSTFTPQQLNNSFQAQHLSASRLGATAQPANINTQISSANLYQNIQGLKQKKQSQSRITYHPYVRTYIDYEERVVLVPVERVKINYYEKIIQTQYVPQAIEEIVTETIAVEKEEIKVRYIPVQQKIIHFPKVEKKYEPQPQKERRVIYVDIPPANRVESILVPLSANSSIPNLPSNNINNLVISFQHNLNANSPPFANSPSAPAIPSQIITHEEVRRHVQTLQSQPHFQEESEQIVFQDRVNDSSNKLGESHVKEIYKPQNQPVGNF